MYVSNPFQVLGKSDPPEVTPSTVAQAVETATPVVEKKSHEFLTFLHHCGTFLVDSVLPLALQIGIPILERKI